MNRVLRILLGCLVLILAATNGWAQATAQINGTVADSSGAVLPGVTVVAVQANTGFRREAVTDASGAIVASAKVTLINQGTSAERTAQTNNSGEYVFSQVIPGTYSVAVETQGFKKVERKNIILETQNQLTIDMQMEVGNLAESISVTTETPLIETATASQGQWQRSPENG